jgi:hypothetical protein
LKAKTVIYRPSSANFEQNRLAYGKLLSDAKDLKPFKMQTIYREEKRPNRKKRPLTSAGIPKPLHGTKDQRRVNNLMNSFGRIVSEHRQL